jgi:hypothetical protein
LLSKKKIRPKEDLIVNSNTPVFMLEEAEVISAGADERSAGLFLAVKEPTAHLLQVHEN